MENNGNKKVIKIKKSIDYFKFFKSTTFLVTVIVSLIIYIFFNHVTSSLTDYKVNEYKSSSFKRFAGSNICLIVLPNNDVVTVNTENGKKIDRIFALREDENKTKQDENINK